MASDVVKSINKEIAELQSKIAVLEEKRAHIESLSVVEQLTIDIHDRICRYNHADGCAWHYEIHNGIHEWNRTEHHRWKSKAAKALNLATNIGLNEESASRLIIGIVEAIK